jgi:hypothetical protein
MKSARPSRWYGIAVAAVGVAVGLAIVGREEPRRAAEIADQRPEGTTPQGRGSRGARKAAAKDEAPRGGEEGRQAPRGPEGEIIVSAPWGSGPGEIGRTRPSEGAPEGPMSFAMDARGRIHVLDQVNSRIQIFEKGKEPRAVPLPSDTYQDIEIDSRGNTVVLDRLVTGTIAFIDDAGTISHSVPIVGPGVPEGGGVTALLARADGVWVEVEHTTSVRVADASGAPDRERPIVQGRPSADGSARLSASLAGPSGASVGVASVAGTADPVQASVAFPMPVVGLHALESDQQGRVYLAANLLREGPAPAFDILEEREMVVVLSRAGLEIGRFDIAPPQGPEEQLRPIRVAADGSIYQLVCRERGATVERFWYR